MFSRREFLKIVGILLGGQKLAWAVQDAGQRFFIPPTIQHLTETSALVYFRLAEHTNNGLLRVSQQDETIQEIPFQTDILRQLIWIENLEPSTNYTYQVLVDGVELPLLDAEEAWSGVSFRTPPYEFPLRVAAVGDSGFGHSVTAAIGKQMAAFEPHLFLHLGDVVYWMHEYDNNHFVNWQKKYFSPFAPLLKSVPHYATFGNHELDTAAWLDGQPSYYWMFPPFNEDQHNGARMWYAFDYNNIQFLGLNSQLFYSSASLRNLQEAWLDEQLARDDVLYTVVFCHVPPYTSSTPHQWDGIYLAEQWVPKFEASSVALVMSGHAHVYERLEQNGIHYVIAGAGSATRYSLGERLPHSQTFYREQANFPIFDFYENRIELAAYNVNGDVIDEASLSV